MACRCSHTERMAKPSLSSPFPADDVARDLGHLRQRRFLKLDRPEGAQRHLSLPFLEVLAVNHFGGAAPSGRSEMLMDYLDDALGDYANTRNAPEAEIIMWLLFGPDDVPIGTYSQGELLEEARKLIDEARKKNGKPGLTEDEFRDRQRGWFLRFPEFLISRDPGPPIDRELDPPAEPQQDPRVG
jgi:hypothetical protein